MYTLEEILENQDDVNRPTHWAMDVLLLASAIINVPITDIKAPTFQLDNDGILLTATINGTMGQMHIGEGAMHRDVRRIH